MRSAATVPSERTRGNAVKLQYALARLLTLAELAATNPSPSLFASLEQEIGKSRALLARAASAPVEPASTHDHAARCALNLQYTLARVVGTASLFAANPGHDTLLALEHEVMCGRAVLGAQDFRPPATHERTESSGCQRRPHAEFPAPGSASAPAASRRLSGLGACLKQGARRLGALFVPEIPAALAAHGVPAAMVIAPGAAAAPQPVAASIPVAPAAHDASPAPAAPAPAPVVAAGTPVATPPAVCSTPAAPTVPTPSRAARVSPETPAPSGPTAGTGSSDHGAATAWETTHRRSSAPGAARPAAPGRAVELDDDPGAFRWPTVNAEAWRARAAAQARADLSRAVPARPHPLGPRRVEEREFRITAFRAERPVRMGSAGNGGGSDQGRWGRAGVEVGLRQVPALVG